MKCSELIDYLESRMLAGKDFDVYFQNEYGGWSFEIDEIILEEIDNESTNSI